MEESTYSMIHEETLSKRQFKFVKRVGGHCIKIDLCNFSFLIYYIAHIQHCLMNDDT